MSKWLWFPLQFFLVLTWFYLRFVWLLIWFCLPSVLGFFLFLLFCMPFIIWHLPARKHCSDATGNVCVPLVSRSCWCAQAGHQCLCVLSTWLVVCLVPCAPMSIVCPFPSCYLIIVSVAPAVSPSLPSFVSLYSLLVSAVLFWSVVFRVSMSCELNVWLCSSLLPACLFFPFGVVFVLLFNFVIKTLNSSAFESSTSSLVTERIRHDEDSAEGATGNHGSRA